MAERVLVFPEDVAVGYFHAHVGDSLVARGPARGNVRIPAGASVHLGVGAPIRGLGCLNPDDLYSLATEKRTTNDTDLSRLSHLTGLRELVCSKAHAVTDRGLAFLRPLQNLHLLDLYATQATDDGLESLAGMIGLERLHLGATRIKGAGVGSLAGLQRLRWLSLEDTDVDDSVVPHLLALRSLRRIAIWGTRLSTKGIRDLQSGLPLQEVSTQDSGQRLARERAREAVLRIFARRLLPDLPSGASIDGVLRRVLPKGSVVAELRYAGKAPRKSNLACDDLDFLALWLPLMPPGSDLRVVTPDGLDAWIPWLRRRSERRQASSRRRVDT